MLMGGFVFSGLLYWASSFEWTGTRFFSLPWCLAAGYVLQIVWIISIEIMSEALFLISYPGKAH